MQLLQIYSYSNRMSANDQKAQCWKFKAAKLSRKSWVASYSYITGYLSQYGYISELATTAGVDNDVLYSYSYIVAQLYSYLRGVCNAQDGAMADLTRPKSLRSIAICIS